MKKVVFKIIDMECATCAISIDGDLEDAPGVTESRTNYAKALTEVAFDPHKISEKKIVEIIKQTGYTAEPL